MRHVIAVVVLLVAACAPEVPTMEATSGGEATGAAGSVGKDSEAVTTLPWKCFPTTTEIERLTLQRLDLLLDSGAYEPWTGYLNGSWVGHKGSIATATASLTNHTDTNTWVERYVNIVSTRSVPAPAQFTWKCTFTNTGGAETRPSFYTCTQNGGLIFTTNCR